MAGLSFFKTVKLSYQFKQERMIPAKLNRLVPMESITSYLYQRY